MLPEFDLMMPETLGEALRLLAEGGPDVMALAGGTNLIPDMRGGSCRPRMLINIAGVDELRGIRLEDECLVVGGGATIAEMLDSPLIAQHAPLLREACASMANPLVRNRATVGGNLTNASPAADTAPPLLALDAEVELVSVQGSRHVRLQDFFLGPSTTVRHPNELLRSVRCPLKPPSANRYSIPPRRDWAYRKLALRKASAVSVVSAAVSVTCDGDQHCLEARIALGAVASTPIRAYAAEAALRGDALTPATIARAAELAAETTRCIDDIRGGAAYRKRVTGVLVRRLLTEAASAGSQEVKR